jgi:hypothetical protein
MFCLEKITLSEKRTPATQHSKEDCYSACVEASGDVNNSVDILQIGVSTL